MAADGCKAHVVGAEEVERRWQSVRRTIEAAPEDDWEAQWSVVGMCPCCYGPARVEKVVCSRCERGGSP